MSLKMAKEIIQHFECASLSGVLPELLACLKFLNNWYLIVIPHTQPSCWGVYWFHSGRPAGRPSPRVRSLAHTVLVESISYLYILSGNFRRCVVCKVSCNISKFEFLANFKFCNFDFVLFWLGIWCESLVWVIMWQWMVFQNEGILVVLVFLWNCC